MTIIAVAVAVFIPYDTRVYCVSEVPAEEIAAVLMNNLDGTNLKETSAEFLQYADQNAEPVTVSRYNYTFDVKLSLYGQWKAKRENPEVLFAFEREKPRDSTHYEAFYVEQETTRTPELRGELSYK